MKILIGYDGSESSGAVFEDLANAGLPRDSQALVVSVADVLATGSGSNAPAVSEFDMFSLASRRAEAVLRRAEAHINQVVKEAKEQAAQAAERLRSQFPGWTVESRAKTGTPTWELINAANDWKADLIVVGSQGRSAIGRLFLGSVSKKIATDALCSVRVVRSAAAPKNENESPRIIIGVDGSPAAEEAIYAVGHGVWQFGTEVKLVAADDGTPPTRIAARLPQAAEMINSYLQKREARVSAMLEWAIAEFNNIGLKTSVLKEKGDPKIVLVEEARKWNADCIFVGTRDLSGFFERLRLGSVSTAVVTNAPCSVEIVRPKTEYRD